MPNPRKGHTLIFFKTIWPGIKIFKIKKLLKYFVAFKQKCTNQFQGSGLYTCRTCSNSIFSYLMLHSTHSFIACFSIVHCHHFLSTNITLTFHCVITPCSLFRSNFILVFLQHIAKLYLALPFQQRFYLLHLYM